MPNTVIPVVFFGLAAWFFFGPGPSLPDVAERAAVAAADIESAPRRTIVADPPTLHIGGHDQRCSDCHSLFDSPLIADPDRLQHGHISLNHGVNDQCSNCHSVEDKDKLVLYVGEEVGYDQVEALCQKCHGPTFRDWERGMHGRSTGSWDPQHPERGRLTCTQCHDPHAPAFPTLRPLPGPNTLRMGEPAHADVEEEDPLLRRMRTGDDHHE